MGLPKLKVRAKGHSRRFATTAKCQRHQDRVGLSNPETTLPRCCVCRDYAYFAFGSEGLTDVAALSTIRGGVAVDTRPGNMAPGEGVGTAYRAEGQIVLASNLKDGSSQHFEFSEDELGALFANAPSLPPAPWSDSPVSDSERVELWSASALGAAVGAGALLAVGAGASLWRRPGANVSTLPKLPRATVGAESN